MQGAAGVSEIASSWLPVEADSRDAHRTANLRSSPTFPVQAKLSVENPDTYACAPRVIRKATTRAGKRITLRRSKERGAFLNFLHTFLDGAGRHDANGVPLIQPRVDQELVDAFGLVCFYDGDCQVLVVHVWTRDDRDTVPLGDARDLRGRLKHEVSGLRVARRADLGAMHTKQDEVQLRNSLRERWGADLRSTTDVPSIVSFERSIDADRKSGASLARDAARLRLHCPYRSR
jgi:hypothetical protein